MPYPDIACFLKPLLHSLTGGGLNWFKGAWPQFLACLPFYYSFVFWTLYRVFVCCYSSRSSCRVTSAAGDVIAATSRDTMQSYQTLGCGAGCSDVTSSCVADFYYPSTTTDQLSSRSCGYRTEPHPATAGDGIGRQTNQ